MPGILDLCPNALMLRYSTWGGWLTHGDLALEAHVDFLAAEHRLIPARVRSEWARRKCKGLASIWAPASQDSSHVGNAGVGVVSLRGARVALPTFATAQFRRFFECGRAIRCLLPLGGVRFMHLAVPYGCQGADSDAEQLALTEQLFDAASGGLGVVARGQPCLIVGVFNVEPTKTPSVAKVISAGRWAGGLVRLLSLFSVLLNGLLLGCLLLMRVGGSKSVEVQRVWGICDDRLQFMARSDALHLGESLLWGSDVSRALLVRSGAAETALA